MQVAVGEPTAEPAEPVAVAMARQEVMQVVRQGFLIVVAVAAGRTVPTPFGQAPAAPA